MNAAEKLDTLRTITNLRRDLAPIAGTPVLKALDHAGIAVGAVVVVAGPKRCAKCSGPIPSPLLGDDPHERCPLCGDEPASRVELAELLRLALHGGVVAIHRNLEGQEGGWRREAWLALDRALDEIDGASRTLESDDYQVCRWCGVEIEATGSGEDWQDEEGSTTCGSHVEGCSACDDGEEHPHEPPCSICEGTGWLLEQGPSGFERCDECKVFADDDAAWEAARRAGVDLTGMSVYLGTDACPEDPDGMHFVGCGCDQ